MSHQGGLSFDTVEDCFAYITDEERAIAFALQDLILEECGGIREKLSYNVPFYSETKRIFFIWPASIPWGNLKSGVALGFCHGASLEDHYGLFEKQELQQVRRIVFKSMNDLKTEIIRDYIRSAYELDQSGLL